MTYQDNLNGLAQPGLGDGAKYRFGARPVSPKVAVPGRLFPMGASVTPATVPTAAQTVVLTLNGRVPLRGGHDLMMVVSGGIEDVAGNALDGQFYGTFPSGNGGPGGNFVAQVTSYHATTFAPVPIRDGYANPAATSPASRTAVRTSGVLHSRTAGPRSAPASTGVQATHDAALASLVSGHSKKRRVR